MSAIAIGKTKFFHKLILPSRTVYYNKVSKTAFPHFHIIIIPHSNKSRDAKYCVSQATPHQTVTLQTIDCQRIKQTGDAKYCVSTGNSIPNCHTSNHWLSTHKPYGRRKILRLYKQPHTKLSHTKLLTVNTQTKRETQNLASLQAYQHNIITQQTIDYQNIKRHKIAIIPVPTIPLSARHIATTAVFIHNHTNYPVAPNTCHCLTSYPTPSRPTISAIQMNNAHRQQGMQSRNA